MLQFKDVELKDNEKANFYLKQKNYFLCAYCFTDIFIWQNAYKTKIAFDDDFMYIKSGSGKNAYFTAPMGRGNLASAIDKMAEVSHAEGAPLRIYALPVEIKEQPLLWELERSIALRSTPVFNSIPPINMVKLSFCSILT